MALCPNHDDINPSLSVRETEKGRILLHCFGTSCPDQRQVYAAVEGALGLEPGALNGPGEDYTPSPIRRDTVRKRRADVDHICPVPDDAPPIARKAKTKKFGKPTKIWTYKNAEGRVMGHIARYDIPATETDPADKVIWPWTFGIREGRREWCVSAMPEPRVLYNLDKIAKNPNAPIVIHEGEKACDAGEELFPNWIHTTPVGGGKAPHMSDFKPLAGRQVIIAPDNDCAGVEFIAQVSEILLELDTTPMILRFPTSYIVEDGALKKEHYAMRQGDDMADHAARGWTTDLIREAVSLSGYPLTWAVEDWPQDNSEAET